MNIDSHQHFWHYNPRKDTWITDEMSVLRKDFLPKDFKAVLNRNGMDGSVVIQAAPTKKETTFLLNLAEENDFVNGIVGWIDLTDEKIENTLISYKETAGKLKGFRHLVQDEPDNEYLLRADFGRGISLLGKYDYTYDILIYPKQLSAAIRFVDRFPEQKLVLDHIAKPFISEAKLEPWTSQIKEMAKYPNVYCKLSGMITEADWTDWTAEDFKPYLDIVFDAFGPHKLMFGSDWPVCLLAGKYAEVKKVITDYIQQYTTQEQQAIMGKNAIEFYQL